MARTTRSELEAALERAARVTGKEYVLNSTASGKRVNVRIPGSTGETHLSPRLPAGKLMLWLRGYLKGLRHGADS